MIFILLKLGLCLAKDSNRRIEEDERLQMRKLDPWYPGWASWTGSSQTSFADWTSWDTGYYQSDVTDVICVATWPTGYDDTGGPPSWVAPATLADQLIISYNFNFPIESVTNQGSAGATFDNSPIIVGTSGQPAKNRGLNFNGTDAGHVKIDNLYLSHSFSLHTWVLPSTVQQMRIFGKDKDSGFATLNYRALGIGIIPDTRIQVGLFKDNDPSDVCRVQSTTNMTTAWTYLVFSFENSGGADTEVVIYWNNVLDAPLSCTNFFYIDKTGYKTYIGLNRYDNSPDSFDSLWNGFIYDFHIYQSHHTTANTNHAATCNTCVSWAFNEYSAASACDASWTGGWVSSRSCTLSASCDTGFYWHLCADVECTSCSGYDDGQCNSNKCAQSGNALESGGYCSCSPGYSRSSIDGLWQACCHADWTSCDFCSATTYEGCQTCGTGYGITYNTSYVYCANFCPTTQTGVGNTCVGTLGTVFEAKFHGFASTWTYNGITLDSIGNTIPSKNRGHYFNRDQFAYMQFTNDFYLNTDFTLTSWIRVDAINLNTQAIFTVTDGQPTELQLLQFYVGNLGQIKVKAYDFDTGVNREALTSAVIIPSTWYFVAASVTLDSDAITSTVTFKVNGDADLIDNLEAHFIDNAPVVAYKRYVGSLDGAQNTSSRHFGGFIFGIWIENVAQSGTRTQYLDPSLWSSCTLWATADNEWLDNYEFTDFASGTWDVSSCTNKSCVRAAAWQSCTFSNCHLCFDIEWVDWAGYTEQDCTQCSANSQSDGTGGWQCLYGADRETAADKNTQCVASWNFRLNGQCVSNCPSPGWYSDTAGQLCIQCPSNWDICHGTGCTICNYPYVLRDDGLCYDSCEGAQYANESREWYDCFGTCTSCVGSGYDQCTTCATGLRPVDSAAQVFACDCSNTTNTRKDVKFSWVDQSQLADINANYVLDHLDSITNSENLNEDDFDIFLNTVDDTALITQSLQHDAIRVINSAGQETITNQPSVEVEVSTEKFYAKLKAEQVAQLEGTKILTSTGSGVQIPVNLISQNVTSRATTLAVNVVQMKGDENQRVLGLNGFDVVSVEVYELFNNGTSSIVQFQDLATNFTIIFDGQRFNTTLHHECVHYTNGNWTNSGCWLSVFDVWYAECTCNHLTEFSLSNVLDQAAPESNVGATLDFASATELDENTNFSPMILVSTIIAIYIIVFLYLNHKDRKKRRQGLHENAQTAEQIHEFALQIMAQQAAEGIDSSSSDSSYISSASEVPSQKYLAQTSSRDVVWQMPIVIPNDELFDNVEYPVSTQQHEMSFSMSKDIEIQNISREILPSLDHQMEQSTALETHTSKFPYESRNAKEMTWDTHISQSPAEIQDAQEEAQETQGEQPQISPKSIQVASNTNKRKQSSNLIVSSTFKNRFFEEHPLLGVFNTNEKKITRKERCTVLFMMIMLTIFCTGLFYSEESDEEQEEDEESALDTWQDMRLRDLFIILYSTIVTIPAPLIIKFLFKRKKIDPSKDYAKQMRAIKIKRVIAYILTFCIAAWCTWSCIAFSLDFGYNKTSRWMFSVLIAYTFDLIVKDNLVTIAIVSLIVCVAYIRDKRNRVKNIPRENSN